MQKKIALINDITGFGRCSTAVMAPIVSAMKIQAVFVPTAILSAHPQFQGFFMDDYTSKMKDYIKTYKDLQLSFDAIATGYLASEEQAEIVIDFVKSFRTANNFVLVDPVMGDHGKLYSIYTPQMCEKMKELIAYADIITPNLTELCALLGTEYCEETITQNMIYEMCRELAAKGPKHIVVTGININDTQIANYIFDAESVNAGNEEFRSVTVDRIGKDRCGTGDVISGIIAGMYLNGHNLYEAVNKAAAFVSKCIDYCEANQVPNHYGLCFEMFMKELIIE